MGFWDVISNSLKNTASTLQQAENEAKNELKYLSNHQLEERIRRCGNNLTDLKKKSIYINELERRRG